MKAPFAINVGLLDPFATYVLRVFVTKMNYKAKQMEPSDRATRMMRLLASAHPTALNKNKKKYNE